MKKLILLITILNFNYVNAYWSCQVNTKATGLIKYKGITYQSAMLKTAENCLNVLIIDYKNKYNKTPDIEIKRLYVNYCVNNTFCKEKD